MASNVRDCAIGYRLFLAFFILVLFLSFIATRYASLAGADEHDKPTLGQPPVILPNFEALSVDSPLKGLRVGIYSPWFDHAGILWFINTYSTMFIYSLI